MFSADLIATGTRTAHYLILDGIQSATLSAKH
jgi:hypothetical protein